jgi:hypothetical protein
LGAWFASCPQGIGTVVLSLIERPTSWQLRERLGILVCTSREVAPCRDDRDLAIARQAIFGQFSASKADAASAGPPNNMKPDAKAYESPTSAQKVGKVDATIAAPAHASLRSLAAKSVQPQNQAVRHCRLTGSQQRPGKHRLNHEATRKFRHSALTLPSESCERNLQKHPRALESRRCYWCHRSLLQQSHIQHLCAGSTEGLFWVWVCMRRRGTGNSRFCEV